LNNLKFLLLLLFFIGKIFAQENISIQLLWKHQFEFAGYYIAKEKGFYEDVGINLEIKEIKPNINVTTEVRENRATFGIGRTGLLVNIENGDNFVLLSSIFQYSPSILMTLKKSGIAFPQDLRNKKVMISSGSEQDVEFFTAFRNLGIDFVNDTHIQQHSTDINDLVNGNTDAMYAYISNEPFVLKEKGIEYNVLNPKNYGFDFYADLLFTKRTTIDKNPDMVKNFKEATIKGFVYAFDNIDETVDLIYNKYNTQHKSKEALRYEAYELKKMAYYETDILGTITKTKLKRMIDLYKDNNLLKHDLDLDSIVFEYNKNDLYLTQEEKEFLAKKKILTVHNELDYKPFNFFISGNPTGYSIDIMNLVAKKLGIEVRYITGPSWSTFLDKLKNQQIDVMLNISPTPNRLKYFDFTIPYKKYNYIIYSNSASKIASIDELKGKKVALVKDFAIYEYIKDHYPSIEINEVDSMHDAIRSVSFAQSDATITIQPIAHSVVIENAIHNVVPTGNVFLDSTEVSQVHLCMATNKKDKVINNILHKALQSLSYEEVTSLEQKWFDNMKINDQKLQFNTNEIDYLKNKKLITMCIDPNWMPYESIQGDKHTGITKEFIDIFEAKIGIPIKLIPTKNWDESIEFAKQRKCDIWSLAMETKQRKEYMNFTKPYISSPLVIATKHDKLFISDIKEIINTKKLGVVRGYAFDDILRLKYPNNKLISVSTVHEGLELVAKGELYGFIDSLMTIGYFLRTDYIGELKIAGKFDENWELGIGVRSDDSVLLSIMDKVVASVDRQTKENIMTQWTSIVFESQSDYTTTFKWLSIILVLLIVFAYRHYILKRYNESLKLANTKIKESNAQMQYLIDTMMEAILIFKDGECIDCNKSAYILLGYSSKNDITGKYVYEFVSLNYISFIEENIQRDMVEPQEISLISKQGKEIPVLIKCQNFKTKAKNIRIVAIFDLREIKEQSNKLKLAYLEISQKQEELYNLNKLLESRVKMEVEANLLKDKLLQQQTRLAQMGELISMIAHQWRQPLASIASTAIGIRLKLELQRYDFSTKEGIDNFIKYVFEQLDDIEKFSQNLTQTIDDFRDFYKPVQKLNTISIEKVILKALDIIEVSIVNNSGVRIIKDFQSTKELPMIHNEMMQVVLNILKNSDDNFREKNSPNRIIRISTKDTPSGIEFEIWDNGGGIRPEHMDKIFDPYFSTKDEKNGTGLGLYMSKVIVCEHHKGTIEAENIDGGVSFIVKLNES
jgi:polar amino acid transport system substrate-binding protein